MQTTTFVKTIKWIYGLEIHETLDFFHAGFEEYLASGKSGITTRIEEAYTRGIELNNRVRQIEQSADATRVLDAFALTDLYDTEWWQAVVATFLQLLAGSDDDPNAGAVVREKLNGLELLRSRIQVLVSCVGPLQQLVVPTSVLRLKDFDDVLTLEVGTASNAAPESNRIEVVLSSTSELYGLLCKIHAIDAPQPLRVLHMTAESGFRFDLTGEAAVILDFKRLIIELWQRIRYQDKPQVKELNKAVSSTLEPYQMIAKRVKQRKLTADAAEQLRNKLSTLAFRMFDQGVQIREIPDTDLVDNRQLIEQISQKPSSKNQAAKAKTTTKSTPAPAATSTSAKPVPAATKAKVAEPTAIDVDEKAKETSKAGAPPKRKRGSSKQRKAA